MWSREKGTLFPFVLRLAFSTFTFSRNFKIVPEEMTTPLLCLRRGKIMKIFYKNFRFDWQSIRNFVEIPAFITEQEWPED